MLMRFHAFEGTRSPNEISRFLTPMRFPYEISCSLLPNFPLRFPDEISCSLPL
jgi:hypothetical protein